MKFLLGTEYGRRFRPFREAAEQMDRAYLRELESLARTLDEAGFDPNDPASTGSLIGPDEHCLHAWVAPDADRIN